MKPKEIKREQVKEYLLNLKNPRGELKHDEQEVILPILTGTTWKDKEGIVHTFKGILNDETVNFVRIRPNGIDAWSSNSFKKLKKESRHWNSEYLYITDHSIPMLDTIDEHIDKPRKEEEVK